MSLFITFEGGDGSGKTTQVDVLCKRLRRDKWHVIRTEEPGGTFLGTMLRRWLTDPQSGLAVLPKERSQLLLVEPPIGDHLLPDIVLQTTAPRAELLLFILSRAQLVDQVIRPNLESGNNIVICDRYTDSTVAYQGYGRGIDLQLINMANRIATQDIRPDLTVLLDVTPEKGLVRKWGASGKDHFEQQELAFHNRVRQGYLELAKSEPQRWLVIDASQPKKQIEELIWRRVSQLLAKRGG